MTTNEVTLLSLPTEIRLQIYQHLFAEQTLRANAFHYPLDDRGSQGHISLQPPSPLLNILFACKQIYQEAIPRFYSLIKFRFERHSVDEINWSLESVLDAFPTCWPLSPCDIHSTTPSKTESLVQRIYYAGNDPQFMRGAESHFPSLKVLEFDLSWDHVGIDQTNFDRAMKQAIRNREWRHAIKDALEQRFPDGMVEAVFDMQKRGLSAAAGGQGGTFGRHFRVLLHWRLAYRFVEFYGECDIDEWVLHVRDPDGASRNIYDIRQDPMFYEMS